MLESMPTILSWFHSEVAVSHSLCYCTFVLFNHCCVWLFDSMDSSTSGFPVIHCIPEFVQTHVCWVSDAIQPSHPLSTSFSSCLHSFPASGSFTNESALHISWLKYCRFSFSISPSNECSGLISFRIDWFDLRAVQGTWWRWRLSRS